MRNEAVGLVFGMTPLELNLKAYREKKGLSQAQLAKLAKVRQAAISDIETGKRRKIDLDALERIAATLGVKPATLLRETVRK